MTVLGKKPQLAWIDKTLLSIEPSYQRTLSAVRSQSLIAKLAAGFCWAHCAPLIVAAKGKAWVIIDGQHRHQAALRRDDIKDLPCYVVEAKDLKAQAKAFVAHNRDRVTLHQLALFHAGVAAGEDICAGTVAAVTAAGVVIPRSATMVSAMAPNQSIATGVMSRIFESEGAARLTEVLTLIREAHPNAMGQLRGRTIGAVAVILRQGAIDRAALVKALTRKDGQALEDAARAGRTATGYSLNEGFVAELVTAAGGDGAAAVAAMRAEDAARGRAQLKALYEAGRPAREAALAKREAERQAKHTAKTAKARVPFRFARSAAAAAKKPAAVEIRGDVEVRRFEMGASGLGNDEFLRKCGWEVSKRPRGYAVKKIGANGAPKLLSHRELIALLNEERAKRKLQPVTVAA